MLQTLLQQAITATRAGQKPQAQQLLAQVLAQDPRNLKALFWMTEAVETDTQRLAWLQKILEIDPNNPQAQRGVQLVQARLAAQAEPEQEPEPDKNAGQDEPATTGAEPPEADAETSAGTTYTLRALTLALRDVRPAERLKAVQVLAGSNNPRALELLVSVLSERDKEVRPAVIQALINWGEPAIKPLVHALQGRSKIARQAAAEALIGIGQPTVNSVVPILRHWDKHTRRVAAQVLDELGWQPDRGEPGAAYWIAKGQWDTCVELGKPAVDLLIAALRDLDSSVRHSAVKAVAKTGDPRTIEALVGALKDRDEKVRDVATEALVAIGKPALAPLAAALHKWSSHRIRQRVAEVLDKLGWQPDQGEAGAAYWIAKGDWAKCAAIGQPAIKPLVATLQDRDSDIRWAAASTLDELGWRPERNEIGAIYWIAKGYWDRCIDLGEAAINPLTIIMRDGDAQSRQAAAKILEKINSRLQAQNENSL